jgi:predicted glycoside hydrolase/deacetylase ChbG (UPF0249 family)
VELADLLRTCPVPHPDEFIDRFYDPIDAQSELLEVLAHLREQQNPKDTWTAELMCHPGFCDADLVAASSYNQQREHELRALTSPETREALKGIQLIHFGDLQAG